MITRQVFTVTLTGAPDATTDLQVIATSIGLVWNSTGDSYATATILGGFEVVTEITNRPNGEVVISRDITDESGTTTEEIHRGSFDSFGYTVGPGSASITIKGRDQYTNPGPATVALDAPLHDIVLNSYGEREFKTDIGTAARPGDSITYNAETIAIRKVQLTMSGKTFSQTLTEQLP